MNSFLGCTMTTRTLLRECVAEALGTWLMVFLGTATVAASVTTGAQAGLWQVAVVWGFAVALAIYLTAHISGAHLNPAVTISLACAPRSRSGFPAYKVLPYIAAQLIGAVLSGICVLALYSSAIARYETRNGITRGAANSTLSAMIFGEYFPNPQLVRAGVLEQADVSPVGAMAVEAIGTMVLMLLIRALTDEANYSRPSAQQAPFYIGFTVASLISVLAPLSQAGFNPARDFGPRIVAALAGWSSVAIPGPQCGFWVYVLGPVVGALAGGVLYDVVVYPAYVATTRCDASHQVLVDAANDDSHDSKLTSADLARHQRVRVSASSANNDTLASPSVSQRGRSPRSAHSHYRTLADATATTA